MSVNQLSKPVDIAAAWRFSMEDHSKDNQPDFIREKIVGKKNIRKEIIRIMGKPVAGGAVSGLTAALVFVFCMLFFRPFLQGNTAVEETDTFSEETQTQSDDIMPENKQELESFVSQIMEEGSLQEESVFYDRIQETVQSLENSMVTVIAVKKDVDWFAVSYDSQYVQSGLLVKETSDRFYVLTGYKSLRDVDSIRAQLADGTRVEAQLEGYDTAFDIAVVSIERKALASYGGEQLNAVKIGGTILNRGTPVFAIGNPDGSEGSVGIGFISSVNEHLALTDCVVKGIRSSVQVNGAGCSFLMGLDGAVLGIFTRAEQNTGAGYSQAYGIGRVMVSVDSIFNGKTISGLGITGQDIDADIMLANEIPGGIYVTDVKKDSASYDAGVQAGDVLAELDGQDIASMEEYEQILRDLVPGREVKMTVYRSSQGAYKKMELKITPAVRQG